MFVFSLVFVLNLSFVLSQKVEAAVTGCAPGIVMDPLNPGTPCSAVAACPPGAVFNTKTGLYCPGMNPNTITGSSINSYADFILDNISVRRGDRNDLEVAILQSILGSTGYLGVEPTGNYLSQTATAVGRLQTFLGVKSDRLFGVQSRNALKKELAKKPDLTRKIVEEIKRIPVKKVITPIKKPGETGPGGTTGETRGVAKCAPAKETSGSRDYEVAFSGDNFKVYVWNKASKTLTPTRIKAVGELATEYPKEGPLRLGPGDQLAVMQLSDTYISNSILGQLTWTDSAGKKYTSHTGGDWDVALSSGSTKATPENMDRLFKEALSANPLWKDPFSIGTNRAEPWKPRVSAEAHYISAFPGGTVPEGNTKFAMYITEGSGAGAATMCHETLNQGCAYPKEGDASILPNGEINCNMPLNPPLEGYVAGRCGPSNIADVYATCEGTYPNVKLTTHILFAPGGVSVSRYPDGVKIGLTGTNIVLEPTVAKGTHLKYTWDSASAPAGSIPSLAAIEAGRFIPQLLHGFVGSPAGFYRNGIASPTFDKTAQVLAMFGVLQPQVKCGASTAQVTEITGVCNTVENTAQMVINLTLSEEVVVTGTPQLQILPNPNGLKLDYLSKNGKTLKFRFIASLADPITNYDTVGNGKFQLTIPADASIKKLDGSSITLPSEYNLPTGMSCPASPTILSGTADYRPGLEAGEASTDFRVNYTLTFSGNVTVTGAPRLVIFGDNNARKVFATYLSGSGTPNIRFHVRNIPTSGTEWAVDYEGGAEIDLNGGMIKDASNTNANITVPSSVVFDNPLVN